ncbi:cupin [Anaerobacillus arseniciselenatis]|uniref:Cupin n=1 Tax=Anaerobacillus arseniciselenatis TaxID=85682 RepID=A0A1S2LV44_9BACI|nr:cupin domain-containing protein [Anaerobacillus arseniciselenatis]OIJ15235.1 cupin [Anaerobacillus arseniciselenatis]
MYYQPNGYSYPSYPYGNTPHHSNYMSRNEQGNYQQGFDTLLTAIKKEASAIDLYHRLAQVAPDQKQKNDIIHALQNKTAHLNHFTQLYSSLTGSQPMYQIDQVSFRSYEEGLQKAYEAGVEAYEEYRNNMLFPQNPLVQNMLLHASNCEKENLTRFEALNQTGIKDYGSNPYVVNIEKATKENDTFRTALWTGEYLQLALMSIGVGEDIGLEVHPDHDQFIRIEEGQGLVQMGDSEFNLDFQQEAYADYAIFVPAGKWHNLTNTGDRPIKLYSIYAPPEHPFGTVHETKAIAVAAEEDHHH